MILTDWDVEYSKGTLTGKTHGPSVYGPCRQSPAFDHGIVPHLICHWPFHDCSNWHMFKKSKDLSNQLSICQQHPGLLPKGMGSICAILLRYRLQEQGEPSLQSS
ncbi:hypothetical protein EMCRGX_G034095 [Ephydatia muelleri]